MGDIIGIILDLVIIGSQERIAPLKHTPLISRLPQLEPQTIRHLEPFSFNFLRGFLFWATPGVSIIIKNTITRNDTFNIIPDSVFIFLCLSKFLVMRNLSFYFTLLLVTKVLQNFENRKKNAQKSKI